MILASRSPRRHQLLRMLGLDFDILPAKIEENLDQTMIPSKLVCKLAIRKAKYIADKKPVSQVIVAADTIVVHQGSIFGQPADISQAKQMLRTLSDSEHHVYTGVAFVRTDQSGIISDKTDFFERTKVTFGSLTDHEIEAYTKSNSPLDKAGAYGIQDDWGAVFVSRIDGDFYNVVGLPIHKFYLHLKHFAPELLSNKYLQDVQTD